MNNNTYITKINNIIKKTIEGIGDSRDQILQISDNLRSEQENYKMELEKINKNINDIITEVDELEKQDRLMRKRLYALKEKRYNLEIALRKSMDSTQNAKKVINQVGIALSYLQGNMLSAFEAQDMDSEMFVGIKILEAQENERKRISRDIHDGPAQYMANIILKADICRKIIESNPNEGIKELLGLRQNAKEALNEVRSIMYDLRPMPLEKVGLNQTIKEIAKAISDGSNIDIKVDLRPMKNEIEPIIQVAVYRIIQEIFNNIKKHSKAKHVQLKFDFGAKYLFLLIADDGIGFDVEETLRRVKAKGNSYGLIGILDRVNQFQGEIQIESFIGEGTVYNVKLPINHEVIMHEKRGN